MTEITYRLVPYERSHAPSIARWAPTEQDREHWTGQPHLILDVERLASWHAGEGCRAFVFLEDAVAVGYGELWDDPAAGEVELARLLVDPEQRGRGVGRRLVEALVGEARELGPREIWLRVFPGNLAAQACYRRAGFERAPPEVEATFNAPQPRPYHWMKWREMGSHFFLTREGQKEV